MAYLHCHNCGWSQDDFWEKDGYNPFRQDIMDWLKEKLFEDFVYMDRNYVEDMLDLGLAVRFRLTDKGCQIKTTDFVATELRRIAHSIQNMHIKTLDEWEEVKPVIKCPRCNKRDWDID